MFVGVVFWGVFFLFCFGGVECCCGVVGLFRVLVAESLKVYVLAWHEKTISLFTRSEVEWSGKVVFNVWMFS